MRLSAYLLTCCAVLCAADVSAQERVFRPRVLVTNAAQRGDTTLIAYRVINDAASTVNMEDFFVDVPVGALTAQNPGPRRNWYARTRYAGRSVATWALLGRALAPGDTTPELAMTGIGLPGIAEYWVGREIPLVAMPEDYDPDTVTASPDADPITHGRVAGKTLSVVSRSSDETPRTGIVVLDEINRFACGESGWEIDASICHSLLVKVKNAGRSLASGDISSARGTLKAYVEELEALRGKKVPEAAFVALSANARWLIERIG